MSTMFSSNLMHRKLKTYPDTAEDTTIIMCAYNEEQTIAQSIQAIVEQQYEGHIRLLVVDNASTDRTKREFIKLQEVVLENRSVEYVYCGQSGKAHALNICLEMVCTPYFITVDADTCLEKQAVQKIMNHIISCKSACVAGNLFVQNPKASIAAKMQNYVYTSIRKNPKSRFKTAFWDLCVSFYSSKSFRVQQSCMVISSVCCIERESGSETQKSIL